MITVMKLISEETQTFENGYDLETNLISAIIFDSEDRSKILDLNYRDKIKREAKIEYLKSKNGTTKVYSPSYDMIAYNS